MQKLLLGVDRLSTFVGQFFAYAIAILTVVICWEVGSRYLFNNPHDWVFDVTYMLYGVLFMMAGAYTLAKNGHVRGDFCTDSLRLVLRLFLIWRSISSSLSQVSSRWSMLESFLRRNRSQLMNILPRLRTGHPFGHLRSSFLWPVDCSSCKVLWKSFVV